MHVALLRAAALHRNGRVRTRGNAACGSAACGVEDHVEASHAFNSDARPGQAPLPGVL
jgi:hypothetical protein